MESRLETLTTADAVVDRLVAMVEDAEEELAITVPPGVLSRVREPLARAVDDGTLVLLLASGYDPVDADDLSEMATVARTWSGHAPLTCTVDGERGLYAPAPFVAGQRADRPATAVVDPTLATALLGAFVGSYWLSGTELYVADPEPLRSAYGSFRHAVVEATLWLRRREPVAARVEGRPRSSVDTETVVGEVVDARQSFVAPVTSSYPLETRLDLETGDGLVTVGGWGALQADYEATSIALDPVD